MRESIWFTARVNGWTHSVGVGADVDVGQRGAEAAHRPVKPEHQHTCHTERSVKALSK